jgi:Spy/CpxP family protein refolding chaperone
MIRRICMSVALASVIVLAAVGSALAADTAGTEGKAKAGEGMRAGHHAFFKDLNLTDEQRSRLDEKKKTDKEKMKAAFDAIRAKRELLREECQKADMDVAKAKQINEELKTLEAQMLDQRLQSIVEVRQILTPEQLKKFNEKMAERKTGSGKGGKEGAWKERHEAKAKVLTEAAAALKETHPDIAKALTDMASGKGKRGSSERTGHMEGHEPPPDMEAPEE